MDITFSLTWVQLLQFAVAVLLPLLVGLVTTKVTKSGVKAVLLLALSVITSLLSVLLAASQAGTTYDLGVGLLLGLSTFIIGVAMHYGLWKPVGATQAAQSVGPTADPTSSAM